MPQSARVQALRKRLRDTAGPKWTAWRQGLDGDVKKLKAWMEMMALMDVPVAASPLTHTNLLVLRCERHLVTYLHNFGPRTAFEAKLATYTTLAGELVVEMEEQTDNNGLIILDPGMPDEEVSTTQLQTGLQEGQYKKMADELMKKLTLFQETGKEYTASGVWSGGI
jgi:hypothetical protein